MLSLVLALVSAVSVIGAPPPPPAPAGCPAGAVGVGESQICPATGSCAGIGLTATVYAAGSCKAVAQATEIGNAGFCGNTFTNGAHVGCNTTINEIDSVTVSRVGHFTKCVYIDNPIICDSSQEHFSEIYECCS